jgi:hypothetical protein
MSTDRAKHAPTPYHYELHPQFCVIRNNEPNARAIAHVMREMDAAFMVQACNYHAKEQTQADKERAERSTRIRKRLSTLPSSVTTAIEALCEMEVMPGPIEAFDLGYSVAVADMVTFLRTNADAHRTIAGHISTQWNLCLTGTADAIESGSWKAEAKP